MLTPMTALGAHQPRTVTIGPVTITESFDLALASVAVRAGQDLTVLAQAAGVPLPGPATCQPGAPYSAFWVAPGLWFVEAPYASHEDIAGRMQAIFGAAASVTEQTDAWVILDLVAPDLTPLLERLSAVDFAAAPDGHSTRTVIDHLGVYLVKQHRGAARLYGPRSSAESLFHALKTAAVSAF
jgi:sarcosine oxidase subunit gamma